MEKREKLAIDAPEAGGGLYSAGTVFLLLVGFIFSLLLFVLDKEGFLPPSYTESDWYIYLSFLLSPFCYALALAFCFIRCRVRVKDVCRGAKGKYFLLAILLQFGLFSLSRANEYFLILLEKMGFSSVNAQIRVPSLNGWSILPVMGVIAVLPAILEEIVFRGVILGSLKRFGCAFSVLVSGALFALFHQNPAQTVYQFACGAAFALVAYKSGSVLPTVLSHFLNNAVVLLLEKFGVASFPPLFYLFSVLALVSSLLLLGFDASRAEKTGTKQEKRLFFLYAAPGIVVCAVFYFLGLFGV